MFVPFKIDTEVIKKITRNGNYEYDTEYIKKRVKDNINFDIIKQHLIDGTNLQEMWFPSESYDSMFDVFISHAHKDEKEVKQLAGYLKSKYGLHSFIDSCYWGYCDELLNKLDDWYASYNKDNKKLYNYNIRNFTTANVHIMLSMALQRMMDACECLLFVDSDNSLKYEKGHTSTPSPWIYEEIGFSRRLRVNIPERYKDKVLVKICESRQFSHIALECYEEQRMPSFNYKIDLRNYESLNPGDFVEVSSITPTTILDIWYQKYGIKKAIDNKLF